jgi:hypothetical protein
MDKIAEIAEEVLHELDSWEQAYPLRFFPEPDLDRAHQILQQHGMSLDSISASSMRHIVSRIVPRVRPLVEAHLNGE